MTTAKHKILGKEVKLYTSVYSNVEEGVEVPTYGIQVGDVIFDDIHTDKDVVVHLVDTFERMLDGDEEARHKIHQLLVDVASEL